MSEEQRKKFKYEIVADQIMDQIRQGRWATGDKLPSEAQLVEEFHVSRVCLREGLKRLNVLGIVRIVQGDGTYVNEANFTELMEPLLSIMSVTENDVEEIYTVRALVQGRASNLAAQKRSDEDIRFLTSAIDRMEEAISLKRYEDYASVDWDFHNQIVKIAGNRILVMLDEAFGKIINSYVTWINSETAYIEKFMLDHHQLLYAIREKDGDFAEQIMRNHMAFAGKIVDRRWHEES